jgi:hypothetical protein
MRTRSVGVLAAAAIALSTLVSTGVLISVPASATVGSRAKAVAPAKKRKPKARTTTTTAAKKSAASLPSDACKLLTTDEVKPLVPGTSPGSSANTSPDPNSVMCRWDDPNALQDVVLTVTKLPSSISTNELTLGLGAEAQDSGKKVSGLGDYAIVTSAIPPNAEVKVLDGHVLLSVELSSDDPLGSTRQDDVVALAKLAFGRL